MVLGKRIESSRKKQQISQTELEKRSGIKREYISRLESGKLTNPTLNTLSKIADGLNVSLESLLFYGSSGLCFQELMQQSQQLKFKIALLKKNLDEIEQTLQYIEKKSAVFYQGN